MEEGRWTGEEIVAFRLHIPSRIVFHNAGPGNPQRGNILAWEQPLAERLRSTPLTLDARMEPQSILYSTLLLFAGTFVAVAMMFAVVVWRILRAGRAGGLAATGMQEATGRETGRAGRAGARPPLPILPFLPVLRRLRTGTLRPPGTFGRR